MKLVKTGNKWLEEKIKIEKITRWGEWKEKFWYFADHNYLTNMNIDDPELHFDHYYDCQDDNNKMECLDKKYASAKKLGVLLCGKVRRMGIDCKSSTDTDPDNWLIFLNFDLRPLHVDISKIDSPLDVLNVFRSL